MGALNDREFARKFINDNCIARVPEGSKELPSYKNQGSGYYRWQFYLRAALFNPVLYPGMGSALFVSQEELGELAGLSRQRTNAAIKALQRAGLVRANYGNLQIVDLQALGSFARRGM